MADESHRPRALRPRGTENTKPPNRQTWEHLGRTGSKVLFCVRTLVRTRWAASTRSGQRNCSDRNEWMVLTDDVSSLGSEFRLISSHVARFHFQLNWSCAWCNWTHTSTAQPISKIAISLSAVEQGRTTSTKRLDQASRQMASRPMDCCIAVTNVRFFFFYRPSLHREWWLSKSIHQNCQPELVAQTASCRELMLARHEPASWRYCCLHFISRVACQMGVTECPSYFPFFPQLDP